MNDIPAEPEEDLLAAVASADMSAFERLYRQYERRVYQYVCGFIRDRGVAEEIVVDTMTSVWNGARTFNGESRVSTWILGIARHKALDAARKQGRRAEHVSIDQAESVPSPHDTPQETTERRLAADATRRAMRALSSDHQEILRLVFYEELPYEDIATLLAIPVNTVKTRVYYAKQQLKLHLQRLESGEPA